MLENKKIELDEIQSLDLHEIINHKLRQAYEIVQQPVIVEDVSAELEVLNGLPGPFIKFFEERLGNDALFKLAGEGARAKIVCSMGYFDGQQSIVVDGIVEGSITRPRGNDGWGFDFCFMPDGLSQTYAELGAEKKSTLSHRHKAAMNMLAALA